MLIRSLIGVGLFSTSTYATYTQLAADSQDICVAIRQTVHVTVTVTVDGATGVQLSSIPKGSHVAGLSHDDVPLSESKAGTVLTRTNEHDYNGKHWHDNGGWIIPAASAKHGYGAKAAELTSSLKKWYSAHAKATSSVDISDGYAGHHAGEVVWYDHEEDSANFLSLPAYPAVRSTKLGSDSEKSWQYASTKDSGNGFPRTTSDTQPTYIPASTENALVSSRFFGSHGWLNISSTRTTSSSLLAAGALHSSSTVPSESSSKSTSKLSSLLSLSSISSHDAAGSSSSRTASSGSSAETSWSLSASEDPSLSSSWTSSILSTSSSIHTSTISSTVHSSSSSVADSSSSSASDSPSSSIFTATSSSIEISSSSTSIVETSSSALSSIAVSDSSNASLEMSSSSIPSSVTITSVGTTSASSSISSSATSSASPVCLADHLSGCTENSQCCGSESTCQQGTCKPCISRHNRAINGGFTDLSNNPWFGTLDGFEPVFSGAYAAAPGNQHDGDGHSYHFQVMRTQEGSTIFVTLEQVVPDLPPGTTVSCTAWLKQIRDDFIGFSVSFLVDSRVIGGKQYTSNGPFTQVGPQELVTIGDEPWISFRIDDNGVHNEDTQALFIDDVSVVPIAGPPGWPLCAE